MLNQAEFDQRLFGGCYVTRGGKIDPWGTIRILSDRVRESDENLNADPTSCVCPGLAMYSEKLVPYGKGAFTASVYASTVTVTRPDGFAVACIPHKDFRAVEIHEMVVDKLGYLHYWIVVEDDPENMPHYTSLLAQALRGEKPDLCDGSPFIRIHPRHAGKRLVALEGYVCDDGDFAIVYTHEGERIPSLLQYPLAHERWGVARPWIHGNESGACETM